MVTGASWRAGGSALALDPHAGGSEHAPLQRVPGPEHVGHHRVAVALARLHQRLVELGVERSSLGLDALEALCLQRVEELRVDDRADVEAAMLRAQTTGEALSMEYRYLHRDGHIVWVVDQAIVLSRLPDGRPHLFQGVVMDITARKEAERAELPAFTPKLAAE